MINRIEYSRVMCLHEGDTLIMRKRGGGERRIPSGKWWINKNTPVGDEAELFERMPYNGRRELQWESLIAVERTTK